MQSRGPFGKSKARFLHPVLFTTTRFEPLASTRFSPAAQEPIYFQGPDVGHATHISIDGQQRRQRGRDGDYRRGSNSYQNIRCCNFEDGHPKPKHAEKRRATDWIVALC